VSEDTKGILKDIRDELRAIHHWVDCQRGRSEPRVTHGQPLRHQEQEHFAVVTECFRDNLKVRLLLEDDQEIAVWCRREGRVILSLGKWQWGCVSIPAEILKAFTDAIDAAGGS